MAMVSRRLRRGAVAFVASAITALVVMGVLVLALVLLACLATGLAVVTSRFIVRRTAAAGRRRPPALMIGPSRSA